MSVTESTGDSGHTPPRSEVLDALDDRIEQARTSLPELRGVLDRIEQTRHEAEASGDLVALAFGWKVRRRFTRRGPLPRGGHYELTIRMEDGRPLVESLTLTPDSPVPVRDLAFNQAELVDEAVRNEALAMTDTWSEPGSVSQQFDRALVGARLARRRNRKMTPAFLREVLDLYEEGGIALVVEKHPTTDRNAYRWLETARKELQ